MSNRALNKSLLFFFCLNEVRAGAVDTTQVFLFRTNYTAYNKGVCIMSEAYKQVLDDLMDISACYEKYSEQLDMLVVKLASMDTESHRRTIADFMMYRRRNLMPLRQRETECLLKLIST